MKNNYYENPQNGGNGEQPMQNPAQTNGTNGQAYLAQPYGNVPNQQNYNQPVEQNNFNNYAGQQAFDNNCQNEQDWNDCQQYNTYQTAWYSDNYALPQQQERYAPPQHTPGEIFNVQRARQQMNHKDLQKGKCTPTDVDFVYDVKGRGFILGELKYLPVDVIHDIWCGNTQPNSRLQLGQELTLIRLVNGLQRGGMPAVLFLTSHGVANPYDVVNTASTIVLAVYYHGYWHNCREKRTLKEHTDYFWKAVLKGRGNYLDAFYNHI